MMKYLTFFALFFLILISCSENKTEKIPEITDDCKSTVVLNVSAKDSIVIDDDINPVIWQGFYSENKIEVFYKIPIGAAGESETYQFILHKTENCLAIDRAYKFYDGSFVDISAVTQMDFKQLFIQEWQKDSFFAGEFVYTDPHDKLTYNQKIWVNLVKDESKLDAIVNFFDCIGNQLPLAIDMDNDNITDFELTYEVTNDRGNIPEFNRYDILLKSTNLEVNQILSPKKSNPPYTVIFEPPFTSENTKQYFNGVKFQLDIFYDFEQPYKSFNYFVSNRLTYYEKLTNEAEDYFLIKLIRDDKEYFGWINFTLNIKECKAEIIDTYLSDYDRVAISVN